MDSFFRTEGSRLVRECSNEILWIEPWGANSLRIRSTLHSGMNGEDWALLPQNVQKAAIDVDDETGSITNGKIRANVSAGGKITFYNQKNEILLQEYVRSRNNLKASEKT